MTSVEDYLTPAELGKALGLTTQTVRAKARSGRFPHLRAGDPPPNGRRDTRPIRFTPEQAQQIADEWFHHVPAAVDL